MELKPTTNSKQFVITVYSDNKKGAVIIDRQEESFIIQKSGSDKDLESLYKQLEGKNLISFFKSGLVTSNSLIPLDSLFC